MEFMHEEVVVIQFLLIYQEGMEVVTVVQRPNYARLLFFFIFYNVAVYYFAAKYGTKIFIPYLNDNSNEPPSKRHENSSPTRKASLKDFMKDYVKKNLLNNSESFILNPIKSSTLKSTERTTLTSTVRTAFKTTAKPDERAIPFNWFLNHSIYRKFYIKRPPVKKKVTIILIVSSAPKRLQRRNMIRETWWTWCKETKHVKPECIFITDYQGQNDEHFHQVQEEQLKYKDMYFQYVRSGVTFGRRFLNHMVFAEIMYDYDYFLRVDDDQFVCLEQLLMELPQPMIKEFHWGWIHPEIPIRRPEECIIMFSRDVVQKFLYQDPKRMQCHPLADQMIGLWMNDLKIVNLLRHDSRIHHVPPVRERPSLRSTMNICHKYMSIHGAYQYDNKILWQHRGDSIVAKGNLHTNSQPFPLSTPFRWDVFGNPWRYEPKLCVSDPIWDASNLHGSKGSFGGREQNEGNK